MSHASTSALLLVDQAGMENVSLKHDPILLKDLLQAVCLTRGTHGEKKNSSRHFDRPEPPSHICYEQESTRVSMPRPEYGGFAAIWSQ